MSMADLNGAENPIRVTCEGVENLPLDKFKFFQGSLKKLTQTNRDRLVRNICRDGFTAPVFIWKDGKSHRILDGHQRIKAVYWMKEKGWDVPDLPVVYVEADNKEHARQKLLAITSQYGEFETEELDGWLDELSQDIKDTLRLVDGELDLARMEMQERATGRLSDLFIIPPLSFLYARSGQWRDRKKAWKLKIGDEGLSREAGGAFNTMFRNRDYAGDIGVTAESSILDPVLAEIAVQWFGLPGGATFDCFAGDTVFGYVSSSLGHSFTGIELREEQAQLNNDRVAEFPDAKYICDDGQNVLDHIAENSQDMLFSCPPYFDLEVYSDKENDASNQGTYEEFLEILKNAFTASAKCLKDDRFAVIVVGDVRNKKTGGYYNFVDDVKSIFIDAGMLLYNELILVDPVGSAQLRARRAMIHRKVSKVHQNVLVFFKGDQKHIKEIYPEVQVADYESDDTE